MAPAVAVEAELEILATAPPASPALGAQAMAATTVVVAAATAPARVPPAEPAAAE